MVLSVSLEVTDLKCIHHFVILNIKST